MAAASAESIISTTYITTLLYHHPSVVHLHALVALHRDNMQRTIIQQETGSAPAFVFPIQSSLSCHASSMMRGEDGGLIRTCVYRKARMTTMEPAGRRGSIIVGPVKWVWVADLLHPSAASKAKQCQFSNYDGPLRVQLW